ncbi:MAG: hypothetical protein ACREBE_00270 [bacterium]
MSASDRRFSAVVSHDAVCLVEYRNDAGSLRVVDQWMNHERSTSIDDALGRLLILLSARGVRRPRLAVAIEQFGVFHHVMTLPPARDDVLASIVRRESQRLFSVADPVVAFTRGVPHERRESGRAVKGATPVQIVVAGAPRETIDALHSTLSAEDVDVEIATVVPKAIHSLYQATGASLETTAVLVCLEGGPHLSFFLDGRLEMAIDPPIALEGERPTVSMIVDQVERGAVFFRQQYRGAAATHMLLASRTKEYDALAGELEQRLSVDVSPLFPGTAAPEAVVAMGAVLEATHDKPLDLYPHPPSLAERARGALHGPNAFVAGAAAAALVAAVWALSQFATLSSTRRESDRVRSTTQAGAASVEPMRLIAERRADLTHQVDFVAASRAERAALTGALGAIADQAPTGVRFDSLRVARAAGGWTASLAGRATGATGAQAVRELDSYFQNIRNRRGVTLATLDDFDYPTASGADSTRDVGPVTIQFHVSFALGKEQPAGGAR